jgi:endonuclease III
MRFWSAKASNPLIGRFPFCRIKFHHVLFMFYIQSMQLGFGFGTDELTAWQRRLGPIVLPRRRRRPIGQLVKSLISGRTLDDVSLAAFERLRARFQCSRAISDADPAEVASVIRDVTFAEAKANWLIATLRMILVSDGSFELTRLSVQPVSESLAWLDRLPGVGRKVAASTLNASVLKRPVMIVDTHVLRVLHRLGFVSERTGYRGASEAVTAALSNWSGDEFFAFHIALKHLGQDVCRWHVPACSRCPLNGNCATARRS